MKKISGLLILTVSIIIFSSCEGKKQKEDLNNYVITNVSPSENYQVVDTTFKYESRTGSTGNYEYNYDVNGTDVDGNNVSGSIDVQGRYGTGTIEDEDGNEKEIDVEWTGKGTLEGTDEDGNTYELNSN